MAVAFVTRRIRLFTNRLQVMELRCYIYKFSGLSNKYATFSASRVALSQHLLGSLFLTQFSAATR